MIRKIKILHIADMHFRHMGRLFYSTARKLNNGFILNGYNVLQISDRDILHRNKNIFDVTGSKALYETILKNIENFKPDLVLFGHVDRLDGEMLIEIKKKYNSIKFSQWFIDPLIEQGPDYLKNKERFFNKYQFCDTNFITTSPDKLKFVDKDKTFFIPNPIDSSIDVYRNFLGNKNYDIFLAISHGQHRGILKKSFIDERVGFIKKLTKKANYKIFGFKNNPIWGQNFYNELKKCSMAINLSRGKPIKYYSSDRISSLLGNGLLTFIHKDYFYQDFLKDMKEIITYRNINDLNKKILYFKKNPKIQKKIAKSGYEKSHKIFNNKIIASFIVNKSLNLKIKKKMCWMDV